MHCEPGEEFLRHAVKEFEQDPEVHNALKILDFEEYRDYYIPVSQLQGEAAQDGANTPQATMSFRVNDRLLCNALANHNHRVRMKQQLDYQQARQSLAPEALRQYQIETALRDWFNQLLNGLEHFGYFIESGMFSAEELRPWLNYWIRLIGDPACRRPGSSKFYDALYSYIHHSGFFGVQKLFERFGYRILPSPYQETDLMSLELADRGYNTRLALTLAKASYLAYQDKKFVAEVVGRWCAAFLHHRGLDLPADAITQQNMDPRTRHTKESVIRHNFRYFNNRGRDTQAYLFRTDEFMVMAFRGSQQPQDWLTNLTTQLRSFTAKSNMASEAAYQGRVHTGFFLAWAIIEEAVVHQLRRWQQELAQQGRSLPPLYITGHSLGGALATMAAAALINVEGVEVAGVYTFGQPRVGDRTFVRQLNRSTQGRVYRFVNNNDIVPHVPPPFSIWNPTRFYGHVGSVRYFDATGSIMSNYKLAARLVNRSIGLIRGAFGAGFDLISDHNMEYYISHLDNVLKEELEAEAAKMLEVGEA